MSCDADIEDSVDLFGKAASDLQENIEVGENAISGTVKYIDDYSSAYGPDMDEGNYLALHFDTGDVSGATITVQLMNGVVGPQVLDPDGICIFRITDKSSQTIKVVASKEGYSNTMKVYDLKGLTLTPKA